MPNRKKNKADQAKIKRLESSVERHKHHIRRLELVLRALTNDIISPEQARFWSGALVGAPSGERADLAAPPGLPAAIGYIRCNRCGLGSGRFLSGRRALSTTLRTTKRTTLRRMRRCMMN